MANVEPREPTKTVNEETVKSLRDAARALMQDEEHRAESLNSRGTALTGFVGLILALAAAAGVVGGTDLPSLDHWVRVALAVLVPLALVALVSAVTVVVVKVIRPLPGKTIHLNDTDRWIDSKFTDLPAVLADGYLTDGYTQALHVGRNRNDGKAKWLGRAYWLVLAGLVLVAAAGVTATIDRNLGGREPAHRGQADGAAGPFRSSGSHSGRPTGGALRVKPVSARKNADY